MDRSEHLLPVAAPGLTEEAHARVPRAVGTVEQPAPVRYVLERHPGRTAECPGEMRQCGVTGDDQVEMAHDGCAVEKRLRPAVKLVSEQLHREVRRWSGQAPGSVGFL